MKVQTQGGSAQGDMTAFILGKSSSVTFKSIIAGQQVTVSITRP